MLENDLADPNNIYFTIGVTYKLKLGSNDNFLRGGTITISHNSHSLVAPCHNMLQSYRATLNPTSLILINKPRDLTKIG